MRPIAEGGGPPVSRVVRGIRVDVVNTRPDIDTGDVLRRADAVIGLVERYQPWRGRHLRRALARILVQRFACRGAYFPDERTCLLELTFMVNPGFTDAQVAALGRVLSFNDPQPQEGPTRAVSADGARRDRNVELVLRDPR